MRTLKVGIARNRHRDTSGFTLLELVLAMLISSLVVGILSVALSFSLKMWERSQAQPNSDMPQMLDLLKWQLASFDPTPVTSEGQSQSVFQGSDSALAFATDRSIKAISKGVPVVVRYVFDAKAKKLYYAEMPFDPYHPKAITDFLAMKPGDEDSWPRFYSTDVASFSLAFASQDSDEHSDTWEEESSLPSMVLVKWSPADDAASVVDLIVPGFFFPIKNKTTQKNPTSANPPVM